MLYKEKIIQDTCSAVLLLHQIDKEKTRCLKETRGKENLHKPDIADARRTWRRLYVKQKLHLRKLIKYYKSYKTYQQRVLLFDKPTNHWSDDDD